MPNTINEHMHWCAWMRAQGKPGAPSVAQVDGWCNCGLPDMVKAARAALTKAYKVGDGDGFKRGWDGAVANATELQ